MNASNGLLPLVSQYDQLRARPPVAADWVRCGHPVRPRFASVRSYRAGPRERCQRHDEAVADYEKQMLRPDYPVRTARLRLRPLGRDDVDAVLAYRGRPDVTRFVPIEPATRANVEQRIADGWASELTDEGQFMIVGVEVASTSALVGDVMLRWISRQHARGEIGYAFHPDAAGHGYATEAGREVMRLGFEQLGLHRITARMDERNEASIALARRLGMRLEGRLVDSEYLKGEWTTKLEFALLRAEWRHDA